jgi:hypothetical protein
MRATVERAVRFDAMSDDLAVTMRACWREQMDGAFEAVEGVRCATLHHFEGLVVVVAANLTLSHRSSDHGPAEAGHYF